MHVNPNLKNYINGRWMESQNDKYLTVTNPATTRRMAKVPVGCTADVDLAARACLVSSETWKKLSHSKRIGYLVRMKQLMEQSFDELAEICTNDSGKTLAESKQELTRALQHLDNAIHQSDLFNLDNTTDGSKQEIREPVGVGACISPFNYPIIAPFAFFPYALACGNTYIVKTSEKVPLALTRIFELFESVHLPPGVLNLVHGGREITQALAAHPAIKVISYIGSGSTAKHIFQQATINDKRIQTVGGSNHSIVVLPDAELETTIRIITESAFGGAGQDFFATSLVIMVGNVAVQLKRKLMEASGTLECGYGLDPRANLGPVISNENLKRVRNLLDLALNEGAEILLDGTPVTVKGFEDGYFLKPTIVGNLKTDSCFVDSVVFGPVLGVMEVDSIEEAIQVINSAASANAASIFTQNEQMARQFRQEVKASHIGINSAAPDPLSFLPSNGLKTARSAVEFFTKKKMVIEYWEADQ
jgi:malonate-semialdehyde dehydrogenase (acetylating)/methylmalonate-semialdehyde dehydrogenase